MAKKPHKKKMEKVPHEEVRSREHSKYEEEPVMTERTKYDEEDQEETPEDEE